MTHFYSTNKQQRTYISHQGFTLIEVVIAVTLLSIILSGVYGIFTTISTTEQRLQSESELYHQCRVIFDRMGRELSGSYYSASNNLSQFSASNENGATYLAFTSTSAITNEGMQVGLIRLRYELNIEPNNTVGKLLRSAVPLFTPDEPHSTQRISSQIKQLQWRFYDGNEWLDEWDSSQSHTLPKNVEINMTLMNNDREISVLTAFDLSLRRIVR